MVCACSKELWLGCPSFPRQLTVNLSAIGRQLWELINPCPSFCSSTSWELRLTKSGRGGGHSSGMGEASMSKGE